MVKNVLPLCSRHIKSKKLRNVLSEDATSFENENSACVVCEIRGALRSYEQAVGKEKKLVAWWEASKKRTWNPGNKGGFSFEAYSRRA